MSSEDAAASLRGPRSQGCRAVEGGRRRRGREEAEKGRIGGFRMQRWGVAAPRGFARRRSKILAAALEAQISHVYFDFLFIYTSFSFFLACR